MKIINTLDKIKDIYINGEFNINKWKDYINKVHPNLVKLCVDDMNEDLNVGVSYEKVYLPILNDVIKNEAIVKEVIKNFNIATKDLEKKIITNFGKSIDVEIILYLGLCNAAGWAKKINNKHYVLLGIEKIIELKWYDIEKITSLIYHELGHIYHFQHGILKEDFNSDSEKFLWQLFEEGIAMFFEQTITVDLEKFHQDKNDWKTWCDANIDKIKNDFNNDLPMMTFATQRYFWDWRDYNGHSDVGYYLGARFIQYINKTHTFEEIISFDLSNVKKHFDDFIKKG